MGPDLHVFLLRLKTLFRKRRMDREMAEELEFHRSMLQAKLRSLSGSCFTPNLLRSRRRVASAALLHLYNVFCFHTFAIKQALLYFNTHSHFTKKYFFSNCLHLRLLFRFTF